MFKLKRILGLYNQVMITGNYLIMAVSFSIGGVLVIKKYISIGELIAITQVMNIIISPIGEVGNALTEMSSSIAVRKKIENSIRVEKKNLYHIAQDTDSVSFYGIECRNISYIVADGEFLLQKVSIKLEPGKKYVIIGPSGCGKTTLLKIISNMLDIESGERSINGLEYEHNEELLTELVSFVHQDTFIFNDTIENNIRLYQNYNKEFFDFAISTAMLYEKVKNRIGSNCSEGGSNLSGGEKQRIAIARAILRNSPVLLLDEITSALDGITAEIIERNLLKMEEKTIVFVTHKIESEFLKRADCIFCMDQGMIIESGSWDALIKEKGYFYKLYAARKNKIEI